MRVLAVDPGEKRIGIAMSDPTGTIANPMTVLKHVSRAVDAATIAQMASENDAKLILVGNALDEEGHPTSQSRRASRLAFLAHHAGRSASLENNFLDLNTFTRV